MPLVVLISALFLLLVVGGIWCALIWLAFRQHPIRWLGAVAVQLSLATGLVALLRGAAIPYALLLSAAPPLGIGIMAAEAREFTAFLGPILPWLGLIIIGVMFVLVPLRIGPWRLLPALLAGLGAFLVMAEAQSRAMMCAGFPGAVIHRHSFLWSVMNTPREFQWDYHAWHNGKAWSYRVPGWVVLPENPNVVPPRQMFTCPP